MNMKHTMRVAFLAVASAALTIPVLAQDAPPPPPPQHGGGPGGHNSPEAQAKNLQRMTRALSLTPDQVTQIKAIDADDEAKMQALNSGGDAPEKGARKQMMQIHKDQLDRTRAVLTDDQKTKFDALQEKMKEKREAAKGEGEAPPPPPPGV